MKNLYSTILTISLFVLTISLFTACTKNILTPTNTDIETSSKIQTVVINEDNTIKEVYLPEIQVVAQRNISR